MAVLEEIREEWRTGDRAGAVFGMVYVTVICTATVALGALLTVGAVALFLAHPVITLALAAAVLAVVLFWVWVVQ